MVNISTLALSFLSLATILAPVLSQDLDFPPSCQAQCPAAINAIMSCHGIGDTTCLCKQRVQDAAQKCQDCVVVNMEDPDEIFLSQLTDDVLSLNCSPGRVKNPAPKSKSATQTSTTFSSLTTTAKTTVTAAPLPKNGAASSATGISAKAIALAALFLGVHLSS
ncbi:hypothetical protein D9611_001932 [Ephemerocybe angulata]|uniref:Extracellular membrane protein CFEM domain-containing protein n=1 Tax=Ephemerocybe angulata TaxID=980116 RepID=A0A8H5CKH1_9AGAR|nr:hypothetical protein D9611_001932 [Tulosesus angulatus]